MHPLLLDLGELGLQTQLGVENLLEFGFLGVGLLAVGVGKLLHRVVAALGGQRQLVLALTQEEIDVAVKLLGLGLELALLPAQRLGLAANRGGGVLERFQIVLDAADVFVDHGDAVGLQGLVDHPVQISRNQSADFFEKRCHEGVLLEVRGEERCEKF